MLTPKLVTFDWDSTLVGGEAAEGIDWIAERFGVRRQVEMATQIAMNGKMSFPVSLATRLTAMHKPESNRILTRAHINQLADSYTKNLICGAHNLMRDLKQLDIPVHVVSGGFREAIIPAAKKIGIPEEHVHAVDLSFDENSIYTGIVQTNNPIATEEDGKWFVIRDLMAQYDIDPAHVTHVGDGATDTGMQTRGVRTINFQGIVARSSAAALASIVVPGRNQHNEPDLRTLMPHIIIPATEHTPHALDW